MRLLNTKFLIGGGVGDTLKDFVLTDRGKRFLHGTQNNLFTGILYTTGLNLWVHYHTYSPLVSCIKDAGLCLYNKCDLHRPEWLDDEDIPTDFDWRFSKTEEVWANKIKQLKKPIILAQVSGGKWDNVIKSRKEWMEHNWMEIAKWVDKELGGSLVYTGYATAKMPLLARLATTTIGQSFRTTIAIARHCDIIVAPGSACVYLAPLFNKSLVCLWSQFWDYDPDKQFKQWHHHFYTYPKAEYLNFGGDNVNQITVDEVKQAIYRSLEGKQKRLHNWQGPC